MKANQKFRTDDDAVSPVIAVILMVAITVVLAATVYVWVSGFSGGQGAAAKTMSLASEGPITTASGDQYKTYTVTAATPGMKYSDIRLTLDGAALPCDADGTYAADGWDVNGASTGCTATDGSGPNQVVNAGDRLRVYDDGSTTLSGKTLRVLDSNANSVMLTLVVG